MSIDSRVFVAVVAGFVVGSAVGFVYSRGVKSRLSESVSSEFGDGKLLVSVDLAGALIGGGLDYFS